MRIFEIIPERFFSILSAQKKELYVDALMVLRTAFKTELLIRRPELFSMMLDSLEDSFLSADFSEEAMEIGEEGESQDLSGKVHLLLRKLRDCGWIEIEYEPGFFEEIVTVPDYAVAFMDLLYDFSHERIREYNSCVYASYAALKNAGENPDFQLQALLSAHQNTEKLVDELKSLFNGIKRYYQRLAGQQDINTLLREHLDQYKEKLFDQIYYPLKTIDSVPRFKGEILRILNAWSMDTGGWNIASESFNKKYQKQIDGLFQLLVISEEQPSAERQREYEKNIAKFTDYKTYLSFDLIVRNEQGEEQRLSKTLLKKSGGETQLP